MAAFNKLENEKTKSYVTIGAITKLSHLSTSGARLSFCHFKTMCRSYRALEVLGLVRLLVVVQSRERRSLDYHQVQKVSILVPGLKIFPF